MTKHIRNLLTEGELAEIQSLIPELDWVDGRTSLAVDSKVKKSNYESTGSGFAYVEIRDIILSALERDKEFSFSMVESANSDIIISKTPVGGYYKPHHDHWGADYSTTLFLNDNYDGGHLCIEDSKYKLAAGEAISYPTGLIHSVEEVTGGDRIVAVFWTESTFMDEALRSIGSDLLKILDILETTGVSNNKEAKNSPSFLARKALMTLKRRYGRML